MTPPLPPALVFLALAVPGIWFTGRRLARSLGVDRLAAAVLAPGVALALWLVVTHVVGLASRSFVVAICGGTLAVGLCGYVVAARALLAGEAERRVRLPWPMWIGAALALAAFAPAALRWAIHDIVGLTDHMSTAAQMQNGVYPPRYLGFPHAALRYHYGFDLLVAAVSAVSRLRLDVAADLVTIAAWGYSWCVLWLLGERCVGPRHGWLTATLALLGGGFSFACRGFPQTLADAVAPCSVEGVAANPPLPSYFLQPPFSLGVLLGACTLLVALHRPRAYARYLLLGLFLLSLWISQVVFFATLAGALAAADVFSESRTSGSGWRTTFVPRMSFQRTVGWVIMLAALLCCTRALGGFATPRSDPSGLDVVVHLGITDTAEGTVRWLAASVGATALVGVPGLLYLRRGRLVCLMLAAGSMAVVMTVAHPHTWDMVKFAAVARLAFAVSGAAAIARLARARPRMVLLPLAVSSTVAMTASGALFLLALGSDASSLRSRWPTAPPRLSDEDDQALMWLRPRIPPGEIMYRALPAARAYAAWGGLPQMWLGPYSESFGFAPIRIAAREKLCRELPTSAQRYASEGVFWFIVAREDEPLAAHVRQWQRAGQAREVAKFGQLEVVELARDADGAE